MGPIARNVDDLAIALTVMAGVGYDQNDNVTASIPSSLTGQDYSAALYGGSLRGMRFGLIEGFFNRTASNETTPVSDVLGDIVSAITATGATVIPITESIYNSSAISTAFDVQKLEYRQEMDTYLARPSLQGIHPSTLNQLYSTGKFLVIPTQYSYVSTALISSTSNVTYAPIKLGIQNLTIALHSTFEANALDALIYPEQANLVVKIGSASQSGRNGILGALTGSPVVTIPAGFSPKSADAPIGVPIGMEILGMPWTEGKLLNIARMVAEVQRVRRMPKSTEAVVETQSLQEVPKIVPDTADIPEAYSIGVL